MTATCIGRVSSVWRSSSVSVKTLSILRMSGLSWGCREACMWRSSCCRREHVGSLSYQRLRSVADNKRLSARKWSPVIDLCCVGPKHAPFLQNLPSLLRDEGALQKGEQVA